MSKITVVGGGSGAFTVSSDLAPHGHDGAVCAIPDEKAVCGVNALKFLAI